MTVKLRLARSGSKKRPFYRIVAADVRAPRDGRYIEKLGHYNPLLPRGHAERYHLDTERARYWLGCGAHPTLRMRHLLVEAGLLAPVAPPTRSKKHLPKAKALARQQEAEAAAPEDSAAPQANTSGTDEGETPTAEDSTETETSEAPAPENSAETQANASEADEEQTPASEDSAAPQADTSGTDEGETPAADVTENDATPPASDEENGS